MIELSLLTLMTTMAPEYCEFRAEGYDHTKSTLLAYSRMHEVYTPQEVQNAVIHGIGIKEVAVATAMIHCPTEVLSD
jgi:hypothetical protein